MTGRMAIFVLCISCLGTMRVQGSREVAHGKPATSSSAHNSLWTADKAVDGNQNTNYRCNSCLHTSQTPNPAFLSVDLEDLHTIKRFEIFFAQTDPGSCSPNGAIQENFKDRSRLYTVLMTNTSSTPGYLCYRDTTIIVSEFDLIQNNSCQGTGRYIRIEQSHVSSEDGIHGPLLVICELRVFGCARGKYGNYCSTNCSVNCVGDICDPDTGACWYGCRDGWQGDKCVTECPDGTHGQKCAYRCGRCRDGVPCNKTTGLCPSGECDPGYKGDICKTECSDFEYGHNCIEICGSCRNNSVCDKITGYCANSECERGYTGPLCKTSCEGATYGYNCMETCGLCRNSSACDFRFGNCSDNLCDPGFVGVLCKTECEKGVYGYNCSESCGFCANNEPCDKISGVCPEPGCTWGYKGQKCKTRCNSAEYGRNCHSKCGYCRDYMCNQVNGTCINGCLGKHLPPLCLSAPHRSYCDKTATIVGNVLALLFIGGVCGGILSWLWRRQISLKRKSEEQNRFNRYEDLRYEVDGEKVTNKGGLYATLGDGDSKQLTVVEGSENETYINVVVD